MELSSSFQTFFLSLDVVVVVVSLFPFDFMLFYGPMSHTPKYTSPYLLKLRVWSHLLHFDVVCFLGIEHYWFCLCMFYPMLICSRTSLYMYNSVFYVDCVCGLCDSLLATVALDCPRSIGHGTFLLLVSATHEFEFFTIWTIIKALKSLSKLSHIFKDMKLLSANAFYMGLHSRRLSISDTMLVWIFTGPHYTQTQTHDRPLQPAVIWEMLHYNNNNQYIERFRRFASLSI